SNVNQIFLHMRIVSFDCRGSLDNEIGRFLCHSNEVLRFRPEREPYEVALHLGFRRISKKPLGPQRDNPIWTLQLLEKEFVVRLPLYRGQRFSYMSTANHFVQLLRLFFSAPPDLSRSSDASHPARRARVLRPTARTLSQSE